MIVNPDVDVYNEKRSQDNTTKNANNINTDMQPK